MIRVWDLESEVVWVLDWGEGDLGNTQYLAFTPQGRLISGGHGGIRRWNFEDGTFEVLQRAKEGQERHIDAAVTSDARFLASFQHGDEHPLVRNLETGESWEVTTHGESHRLAMDAGGQVLVTTGPGGQLRVGPVSAGSAHLVLGNEGRVWEIAVSPDGRWIALTSEDGAIRLWPIPDEGEPFHTLPYDELLEPLRALTNLRATRDHEALGGYRLEAGAFPGWENAPTW